MVFQLLPWGKFLWEKYFQISCAVVYPVYRIDRDHWAMHRNVCNVWPPFYYSTLSEYWWNTYVISKSLNSQRHQLYFFSFAIGIYFWTVMAQIVFNKTITISLPNVAESHPLDSSLLSFRLPSFMIIASLWNEMSKKSGGMRSGGDYAGQRENEEVSETRTGGSEKDWRSRQSGRGI